MALSTFFFVKNGNRVAMYEEELIESGKDSREISIKLKKHFVSFSKNLLRLKILKDPSF